jgi:ubiquitin carboxyl-terminal hydrolase 22/27/51
MYSGVTTPHAPTTLLHTLWTSFKHLAGYEQQDAHEFLVALLYKLHEHLGGRTFGCDCLIHQTFSGVLQSSVTCLGCGACSPVFDPFMDICLDVVVGVGEEEPLALQTCLDRFCAVETLPGGSYVCAACQSTYREAHKQLSIRKPPLTLCLQLKRFGQGAMVLSLDSSATVSVSSTSTTSATIGSSKLSHHVSFPELFSLTPYLSETIMRQQDNGHHTNHNTTQNLYKLASVIHHIGDQDSSGHYVAYLNHHSAWYKCDDAMVTEVSAEEVYSVQAYMLFYNKI